MALQASDRSALPAPQFKLFNVALDFKLNYSGLAKFCSNISASLKISHFEILVLFVCVCILHFNFWAP